MRWPDPLSWQQETSDEGLAAARVREQQEQKQEQTAQVIPRRLDGFFFIADDSTTAIDQDHAADLEQAVEIVVVERRMEVEAAPLDTGTSEKDDDRRDDPARAGGVTQRRRGLQEQHEPEARKRMVHHPREIVAPPHPRAIDR